MGRVDRILRLREPARGESRNKESGGRTSRSSQPKAPTSVNRTAGDRAEMLCEKRNQYAAGEKFSSGCVFS